MLFQINDFSIERIMKIYFAGSISGGRNFLATYKKIVNLLKSYGHYVLSEHIIRDDILDF